MVYAANLCKSQRVMHWRLIFEEFGPTFQHIVGVDNIVADTISRFPSTPVNKYNHSTSKAHCLTSKLFTIGGEENN